MASPIAGPSRLPFNAIRTVVRQRLPTASRYASSAAAGDDQPVDQRTQEAEDAYRSWIRTTGMQYESVRTGQRALWLGGNQPFPANPSFRPPPPLSDDLQNVLYDKLRSGSTVAQLSHRYNVSKARIEAIRKLKDVELEFKRQHLPIQSAFLKGMEGLLGVKSPLDPMTKVGDSARERDEATQRAAHPSTGIERAEEDRWDAGLGSGGSFGDRATQATSEGIERTVWEFRDEETEMKEKRAVKEAELAAKARPGVREAAEEVLAAQAGSATPESARVVEAMTNRPVDQARQEAEEAREAAAHSARKGGFNFVDVSGQAKWKQAKGKGRK